MTHSTSWRRQREARRQPPPCIAEDGNPEGNNLRPGTMKTEPSFEQYETFSIQIQPLQETGYQQQEERCKSGAMQLYRTTRLYRMLYKGRLHARPRNNPDQDPFYTKTKHFIYYVLEKDKKYPNLNLSLHFEFLHYFLFQVNFLTMFVRFLWHIL